MARCEDWPCCGHEAGCCPDRHPDSGEQINMKCTCGAPVPLHSETSICEPCLERLFAEEREGATFAEQSDTVGYDPETNLYEN